MNKADQIFIDRLQQLYVDYESSLTLIHVRKCMDYGLTNNA